MSSTGSVSGGSVSTASRALDDLRAKVAAALESSGANPWAAADFAIPVIVAEVVEALRVSCPIPTEHAVDAADFVAREYGVSRG